MKARRKIGLALVACMAMPSFAADQAGLPSVPEPTLEQEFEKRTRIEGEDGTIPPVAERNPDPTAGTRIWVHEFSLKDIPVFPDDGITREGVASLVEQLRYDSMRLKEHVGLGYQRQDLVDIAQILNNIESRGMFAEVTPTDMEPLMDIVAEQRLKRGLTQGQLEEVAQAVTRYYRERGYILARAYIPAQEVAGGIVELRVLEGRLDSVQVQGEHRTDDALLTGPFTELVGGPVTADNIQGAMYLANDLPGVDVFGYFSPGTKIGTTKLNMNVRSEKRWDALLRIDNHGSEFTGDYRAFGLAQWLNPTGIGDEFQLGVLRTGSPSNSTYGLIEYQTPVFGLRNRAGINVSYNDYVVGALGSGNTDDLTGTTTTVEATFRHNFVRGRRANFYAGLVAANKQSELSGISGTFVKEEESRNIGITADWDRLFERKRMLSKVAVQVDSGEVLDGLELGQSDTFTKLYFEGSALFFVPAFFSDAAHRVVFNSVVQWSDVKMPSVELYSLGGPNAVRAYDTTLFSVDRAGFAELEMYLDLPKALDIGLASGRSLKDVLQFTVFVDYAYGTQVALEPTVGPAPIDQWASLTGAGIGVRFNWGNSLNAMLSVAKPVESRFSDPDVSISSDDQSAQFWFETTYVFN